MGTEAAFAGQPQPQACLLEAEPGLASAGFACIGGPLDVADAMALPGAVLAEPGATAATEPPRVVVIGPEGGFSTE